MPDPARRLPAALAASVLLLAVGCGEPAGPDRAPVHGTVTYKGKPLTFGQVIFFPATPPADGPPMPSSGDIGADGTYKLASGPDAGAILGDHKVVVFAVENKPGAAPAKAAPKADAAAGPDAAPPVSASTGSLKSILPKKYESQESTPLTKTVKAGDNTIDLEIVD